MYRVFFESPIFNDSFYINALFFKKTVVILVIIVVSL